jgi:hypothetical protein
MQARDRSGFWAASFSMQVTNTGRMARSIIFRQSREQSIFLSFAIVGPRTFSGPASNRAREKRFGGGFHDFWATKFS